MYELVKLTDKTYYINCPAKIGLHIGEKGEAYLIDSGNDKNAAKKSLRILESMGLTLAAVLNTHSHADHTGGNAFLQEKTGCKIFSGGIERAVTENPILEPVSLFGGFPPKELCSKFLLAKPSSVTDFSHCAFPRDVTVVPLPGHSYDMVGYRFSDGVFFVADSLASEQTLEKYKITFVYDVKQYLETLEQLKTEKAKIFVPSHAEAAEDISNLAQININKTQELAKVIASLCAIPLCFDDLLQKIFQHYNLIMDFTQYALVGSTLRSYLAYLMQQGKITAQVCDNKVVYACI